MEDDWWCASATDSDFYAHTDILKPVAFTDIDYSSFSNGVTSGIPTRTTSTITPTTLKNIEESFLELQSIPPAPMEHQHQAGFVPPVVNMAQYQQQQQQHITVKQELEDDWMPSCAQHLANGNGISLPTTTTSPAPTAPAKGPRTGGGRRPNRSEKLSPEEEERRRIRRERNKLAAARCRKRRLDHTNLLIKETEGLEERRNALQSEIQALRNQKEELEFILEAHRATCKVLQHKNQTTDNGKQRVKFARPNSLPVSSAFTNVDGSSALGTAATTSIASEVAGVPIQTPSAGMFSFESLVEGTGLTPSGTTPLAGFSPMISCGGQQRSSSSDLSSPDTMNPPKLVSL